MEKTPVLSLEMSVIAGLLNAGLDKFLRYGIGISEEFFLDKRCRKVFSVMKKFAEKSKQFNPMIVSLEFVGDDSVGDRFWEAIMTADVAEWEIKGHLRGLLDTVFRNRLRTIVLKDMREETFDETILKIQEHIDRYHHSTFSDWSLSAALKRTLDFIELKMKGEVEFQFGLQTLNDTLCGLFRKEMTLIAGRTSHGKSAMAAFIANHLINCRKTVLYIDLESGEIPMLERFLSLRSGVVGFTIHNGRLSGEDLTKVAKEAAKLEKLPLYINDAASPTLGDIYDNALSVKADVVIVDYIQLLAGEDSIEALGKAALGLHHLAKNLNIPVIVISQLNRQPDHREGHIPALRDIRGYGGIEERSDNVLLMHWPFKYDPENKPKNVTKVVIAKQKHGPIGTKSLFWEPETFKFGDMTAEQEEYYDND